MKKAVQKLNKLKKWLTPNRCFTAAAAMVALLILVFTAKAAELESISLEQELRCGQQTHLHTDECFRDDILICPIPEHVHTTNCYLVLLADNDMGIVLNETEAVREKTLEAVIRHAVDSALVFNRLAPDAQVLVLDETSISELNETIRTANEIPPLVLNENLNKTDDMTALLEALAAAEREIDLKPSDTVIVQKPISTTDPVDETSPDDPGDDPGEDPGTTADLQATGVNPVTTNNRANIYIMLDGSWNCIGNVATTTSGNRTISAQNINNLLKDVDGTTRSNTSPGYSIRHKAANAANYSNNVSVSGGNFTLANLRTSWSVRLYANNNTELKFYTVTFVYPNETVQRIFRSGAVIDFNSASYSDYNWVEGSNTYTAGNTLAVTRKMTLTAVKPAPPESINIQYTMNFPSISGVTFSDKNTPRFQSGGTTTYSYSSSKNTSITIEDITNRYPESNVLTNNSPGQTRVIHFAGWRVGNTDTILSPGATLSWEAIMQYATGNSLKLTGVWEYHTSQSCTFYLRYDSVAVDTDGNITSRDQNLYTPQLHSTFVANVDTSKSTTTLTNLYGVADVTADNSYTADQNIRALYGERPNMPYLVTFPDDEDVFEQLKQYADHLSVDNIPVSVNDLNSNGYAIRWYVFKCQNDAWHIDGKLVRKLGNLEITKTFAGNKLAIEEVKKNFRILVHGSRLGDKELTLSNATTVSNDGTVYFWSIPGMTYGEDLTIQEYDYQTRNYRCFSEYSVVDAAGIQSTEKVTGNPGVIKLKGMTYATDTGFNEVLRVDLFNIYYGLDSLILKKLDDTTGNALGGAEFELWQTVPVRELNAETEQPMQKDAEIEEISDPQQPADAEEAQTEPLADPSAAMENTEEAAESASVSSMADSLPDDEPEDIDSESVDASSVPMADDLPSADLLAEEDTETAEVLLHFRKDEASGAYVYDPNGEVTRLSATNGFYEVSINGISLERGPITVKEIVVPEGYTPVEAIVLTKQDGKVIVQDDAARFENNVLYIPNNSDTVSIVAEKHWEIEEKHRKEVTVLLMANGHLVTTLFPALADDSLVVLNSENNWTYRWDNLPTYANGNKVEWSIREIRIGDERIRDDGTFLNYLVRYDSTLDADGNLVLRVWNDLRRIMLRVHKTNWARSEAVPGATYLLVKLAQQEDGSYAVDPTFDSIRLVSDEAGLMVFEGIQYGRYLLIEENAPVGFYIGDPIELTLNEDGSVTVWNGPAEYNDIVYNLTVRELEKEPLPTTGSSSELWFRIAGIVMFLMLLTPSLLRKRRCRNHS